MEKRSARAQKVTESLKGPRADTHTGNDPQDAVAKMFATSYNETVASEDIPMIPRTTFRAWAFAILVQRVRSRVFGARIPEPSMDNPSPCLQSLSGWVTYTTANDGGSTYLPTCSEILVPIEARTVPRYF